MGLITRIGLGVALSAAVLLAGKFETSVESLLKKDVGVDTKVVKSIDVGDGLKFLVMEVKDSGMQMPIFSSSDGSTLFGFTQDLFTDNTKVKETIGKELQAMMAHNEKAKAKEAMSLYKKIPKENIISIDEGKPKTLVIISDPECPYCRKELSHIDERLKDANIQMIIAPVHGKSAFIKGDLIYDAMKKAKNNKEKVAILQKYFSPGYKLSSKEEAMTPKMTQKNADIVFSSGIVKGVPFVFELQK